MLPCTPSKAGGITWRTGFRCSPTRATPPYLRIFDGHGGEAAAAFVKTHLAEALRLQLLAYKRERPRPRKIYEKKERGGLSYPSIPEQQILTLEKCWTNSANYNEAGTTCLVALLSDKEFIVANVGDSRGVLCNKDGNTILLSHDRKPYQLKRIKKAGRFISFNSLWCVQGIGAKSIVLQSFYRGCPDNITIMVVKFKGKTFEKK
ncbi:hypothetical protein AMECASPLE_035666 [Ameca splendens]|uniref:PPM-type phosphatase domain-containing protein n=1 Tax=Ameca splendens TaxID=208324 RepID=A0ABV0YUQ3_9TELE